MNASLQADILYILDNPWEVTAWEFDLNGKTNFENTLPLIQSKITEAEAHGFFKLWKTEEGLPISMLICYPLDKNCYETMFLSSIQMNIHGLSITKALKKVLQTVTSSHSEDFYCRSFSSSNHPAVIRWFEFIGFTYKPEDRIGNSRCFEFYKT